VSPTSGSQMDKDLEALWLQLETKRQPVYVCTLYRPPDKNNDYIEVLQKPLEIISDKHNKPALIVIAGDFNYPKIEWSSPTASLTEEGKALLDLFDDFHLQQMVSYPTRYSCESSFLLDLVVTSHPSCVTDCTVASVFPDHCAINFFLNRLLDLVALQGEFIYAVKVTTEAFNIADAFIVPVRSKPLLQSWNIFTVKSQKLIKIADLARVTSYCHIVTCKVAQRGRDCQQCLLCEFLFCLNVCLTGHEQVTTLTQMPISQQILDDCNCFHGS
jgi:Endonuclease-reverse transcriptase